MRSITVIHFGPLEHYPPVQNIINALASMKDRYEIVVLTTSLDRALVETFESPGSQVRIIRFGPSGRSLSAWRRYMTYLRFYLGSIWQLMIYRPEKVFYIETLSSLPAIIYKRWINKWCKLYAHYHEYISPEEFRTGMSLVRRFHALEMKTYSQMAWVSHTNTYRMQLFKKDIFPYVITHDFIMPNYPPAHWHRPPKPVGRPVRIIAAGAISMTTMFTREFAEWVIAGEGKVIWNIYSLNITEEAAQFIRDLRSPWITLRDSVPYHLLPDVLAAHDVGVILYKGHIPNYVHNAPNKLFEYVACGLDVWFPKTMSGSLPYITVTTKPRITALDFLALNEYSWEELASTHKTEIKKSEFFCEEAINELITKLMVHHG